MDAKTPDKEPFLLKNIYTRELLEEYGRLLGEIWAPFSRDRFLELVFDAQWEQLELKQRMRRISACLREVLPDDYARAAGILTESTRRLVAARGETMNFEHMFIPDFVEQFGLDAPEVSIPALGEMTRWTSAEFAVRPYLLRYPERMYAQMLEWSRHESPMVRRLSSEGFRPRLPWGMGVPALKKDTSPILAVLENLKNDPSETVRRSVANNLNDIAKGHPELVLDIAARWMGHHPGTDWIVRHACRGLLKRGHPDALALFGFEHGLDGVEVEAPACTPEVPVGGRLDFSFTLRNTHDTPANVRLEYAIDYCTLSGKTSRKVFKITEFILPPGAAQSFSRTQRFQDFTTRKHYPGAHRIEIVVNGVAAAGKDFVVLAPLLK